MSQVDKLLAKALSTDSEDEAIACLRMARKQGKPSNQESSDDSTTYAGKSAKHWYDSAVFLGKEYKNLKLKCKRIIEVQEQRVQFLEEKIVRLYAAIPLSIAITAVITYLLLPKTIVASCWLF